MRNNLINCAINRQALGNSTLLSKAKLANLKKQKVSYSIRYQVQGKPTIFQVMPCLSLTGHGTSTLLSKPKRLNIRDDKVTYYVNYWVPWETNNLPSCALPIKLTCLGQFQVVPCLSNWQALDNFKLGLAYQIDRPWGIPRCCQNQYDLILKMIK